MPTEETNKMEEKNELPVEVVQEIEDKARASIRLKGWGESLQFECYVRGATAYATKLHQAEQLAERRTIETMKHFQSARDEAYSAKQLLEEIIKQDNQGVAYISEELIKKIKTFLYGE